MLQIFARDEGGAHEKNIRERKREDIADIHKKKI